MHLYKGKINMENILIRTATAGDTSAIRNIYNSICEEDGIYFRQMSDENVGCVFFGENVRTVCAVADGCTVGFASGTVVAEKGTSYITYVGVEKQKRRQNIGSRLLRALEERLACDGIKKIDIVFHNPVSLSWYIPHTGKSADHPCAPGVDADAPAYPFFGSCGYSEWCRQYSYYLPLKDYREPEDIAQKKQALSAQGINITLYDAGIHTGFYGLFDEINNPGWRNYVFRNLDKPVIVAVDTRSNNRVIGYTGPLTVQESGRGNFCGIGTSPDYRKKGIGKAVFCEMCKRHAESGAAFMSLYTGSTNPARNIYEAAGFRIVREWANMRKEII